MRNDNKEPLHLHILRFFALFAIAFCLIMFAPFVSTNGQNLAFADTQRMAELEQQLNGYKESIQNSQTEYLNALQMSLDLDAQIQQTQIVIDDLQAQIDVKQDELNKIVRDEYRQSSLNNFFDLFCNAHDFFTALQTIEYFQKIEENKVKSISEIQNLKAEQETQKKGLEEMKISALEQANAAQERENMFHGLIDEIKPELEELWVSFSDELNNMSASTQLATSLNYLQNIKGITTVQANIITQSYQGYYSGGNRCEAWAELVYRKAGLSIPNKASAYESYASYYISDTKHDIPAGAWVYGSGTSVPYSHVGIYLGNGLVMDNEGSRKMKAVPLEEWISWQTAVSSNNGRSGWFGWGYPPDLAEYFVQ